MKRIVNSSRLARSCGVLVAAWAAWGFVFPFILFLSFLPV
jgi:hypothetical protein